MSTDTVTTFLALLAVVALVVVVVTACTAPVASVFCGGMSTPPSTISTFRPAFS